MKGVTIISEKTYPGVSLGIVITFFILCIAAIIFVIWLLEQNRHAEYEPPFWRSGNMIVVAILVGLLFMAGYMIIDEYNTTYTEYTVEVDETASINEFLDKYEIVSRDGNTYVVKERDTNG